MSIKEDLIETYRYGDITTKLVLINSAVFVTLSLLDAMCILFNIHVPPYGSLSYFFECPNQPAELLTRPWTVITYMFLHGHFLHFIFNMLALYWFGKVFMKFCSERDLVNLYILGGLAGAATFILGGQILESMQGQMSMCGASASITALIVAVGTLKPDHEERLALIGDVKLKWISLFVIVFSLISIKDGNIGGNISHIGGALAGWLFTINLKRGKNIAGWIGIILDKITNLFKRKPQWHVVQDQTRARVVDDGEYNMRKRQEQKEIDSILDKIKKTGYDSLTNDEKRKLFDASQK